MTVSELIEELRKYPEDCKVIGTMATTFGLEVISVARAILDGEVVLFLRDEDEEDEEDE